MGRGPRLSGERTTAAGFRLPSGGPAAVALRATSRGDVPESRVGLLAEMPLDGTPGVEYKAGTMSDVRNERGLLLALLLSGAGEG